jgi:hypothetical protein
MIDMPDSNGLTSKKEQKAFTSIYKTKDGYTLNRSSPKGILVLEVST